MAANLAWSLAQTGKSVALVDLDFAAATQHLVFGAPHAPPTLLALLTEEGDPRYAFVETPLPTLRLVTSRPGLVRANALGPRAPLRLLDRLLEFDFDCVVLDVGAGEGYDAIDFFELGDQRIIVASGQPSSVHEAFALLKAAVWRSLRRTLEAHGLTEVFAMPAFYTEGEKLGEITLRLSRHAPQAAAELGAKLARFGTFLFGNQLQDATQVGVLQAISKMGVTYLSVEAPVLGWMRAGARIPDLTSAKHLNPGVGEEARVFLEVAQLLLAAGRADTYELRRVPTPAESAVSLPIASETTPPERRVTPMGVRVTHPSSSARVKPFVYERPPRRRRLEPAMSVAVEDPRLRKRSVTLPGMPPRRVEK